MYRVRKVLGRGVWLSFGEFYFHGMDSHPMGYCICRDWTRIGLTLIHQTSIITIRNWDSLDAEKGIGKATSEQKPIPNT